MRRQLPTLQPARIAYLPCAGGYDSETPGWSVKDGALRAALNYEVSEAGGYQDIAGYERFDGRAAPSDADYYVVTVTLAGVAVGDTVTQDVSGATGVVIAVVDSTTDYIVMTRTTGTFNASDVYRVGGVVKATPSETPVPSGASSALLHAQYTNLAADSYRSLITAVPGSGVGRGLFGLNGTIYAMRNNAGGTAAEIYKSTGSGWTLVSLGRRVAFTSGGTYEIVEGNTITGATSGATAVITRVVLQTGSWAAGTAAGWLIFATDTGTFQAENLNVGANTNVATIAGDASAITLSPGGRLKTYTTNFGGAFATSRVYGADGVNLGWEFDGTVFVPIPTGMSTDTPHDVIEHKGHLFFAFGASLQHSGTGDPYSWTLLTGANEIAMSSRVTGLMIEPGTYGSAALTIFTRDRIHILYGNSTSDWELVTYRESIGAVENSVQQVFDTIFLDDAGLTTISASQAYGNFAASSLSDRATRYLIERRGAVLCSTVCRDKTQYRLFFNDGSGVYMTMSGGRNKVAGIMPIQFSDVPYVMYREETSAGVERMFFIDGSGYVMQLDRGTSFDGDNIDAGFAMHFSFLGSFGILKKYLSAYAEIQGSGYAEYMARHDVSYATSDQLQQTNVSKDASLSNSSWDGSGAWDSGGVWDPQNILPQRIKLSGEGENLSIEISKSSDYMTPIMFSGFRIRYIPRRQVR